MVRVLVVEDLELLRRLVERFLKKIAEDRKEECQSTIVPSARDAIETCKTNDFDLAFIDVDLGMDMNGLELARRLRESKPTLRIIMMSSEPGYGSESVSNFDGFMQKPFTMDEFRYFAFEKK